jgi:hypothetical protein
VEQVDDGVVVHDREIVSGSQEPAVAFGIEPGNEGAAGHDAGPRVLHHHVDVAERAITGVPVLQDAVAPAHVCQPERGIPDEARQVVGVQAPGQQHRT